MRGRYSQRQLTECVFQIATTYTGMYSNTFDSSGYFFDDKDKLSLEVVCSEEERDWEAAWEACINPEGNIFKAKIKTRQKSKSFSFSSDRFCPNPPARPSNGGLSDWNEGDPPRNYQACL